MAEQFIYRSVKKTKGTDVIGSSQVNQGTGGSGSSGGGSSATLNPTLGQLINVSKSADNQTEEKVIKWNPVTKLWEVSTPKTTIASLDNVDNNADATNPTDSSIFLGIGPGESEYKQVFLPDLLNGYAFEGDVSAQQEREFNIDFPEAQPDTSYKLDVQGWNEQTVLFEGNNVVIRNIIQYHSLVKRTNGFSVKFFQIVDFLSYSALFKSNASPVPDFPHVTIRMSGAGLMDLSVSGATGVKWVMYTGEVYTQGSQVPSGDINRPQIQFSEAGWVKLYVDDFSVITDLFIGSVGTFIVSRIADFAASPYINLAGGINIEGDLSESINITRVIALDRCYKVTGDVKYITATDFVSFRQNELITINDSTDAISANTMFLDSCNLSQLEIYNLIKYNYDLNNTNKTLNITNNSVPDATTLAMINEMTTTRGWTITHD